MHEKGQQREHRGNHRQDNEADDQQHADRLLVDLVQGGVGQNSKGN